jgi:hypothetical protein
VVEQRLEQHRRAQGVDARVLGDLVHALADADAGGEVHDLVHPLERLAQALGVAHVTDDELGVGGQVAGSSGSSVDLRVQAVEHPDLVAPLEQRRRDVGADEAGSTGDQDPCHGTALSPPSQEPVLSSCLPSAGGCILNHRTRRYPSRRSSSHRR